MAKGKALDKSVSDRLVGRRIRRRRIALNMTQSALADALGVSYQQVQRHEKGEAPIRAQRLKEIAHLLGVPPGYFDTRLAVSPDNADQLERFIASEESLRLFGAFARIADGPTRQRLVNAIEAISESRLASGQPRIVDAWLQQLSRDGGPSDYAQEAAAAVRALKSELAKLVGHTIKSRKMSQAYTAQILSTDQGRISVVARGMIRAISLEMLLRYLLQLGWDLSLSVKERPIERKAVIQTVTGKDAPDEKPIAAG